MKREDFVDLIESEAMTQEASWRRIWRYEKMGASRILGQPIEVWGARIGGAARLAIEERRRAEAILELDGLSKRKMAKVLGVSETTVRRDQGATNVAPEPADPSRNGDQGATNVAPVTPSPNGVAAKNVAVSNKELRKELSARWQRWKDTEGRQGTSAAREMAEAFDFVRWRISRSEHEDMGGLRRELEHERRGLSPLGRFMNDELELIYVRRCRECDVRRPLGWFRAGRICIMCLPEGVRGAPSCVLTLTDKGRETARVR